jgi:hypothetical protein
MSPPATSGINPPFGGLSPSLGQVAYVLLNRLPLNERQVSHPARLAYIRHAASVRPEPGSNSPSDLDPVSAAASQRKRALTRKGFWRPVAHAPERGAVPLQAFRCCPTVQFSRIPHDTHKKPPLAPGHPMAVTSPLGFPLERGGVSHSSCFSVRHYTKHRFDCQEFFNNI